MRRHLRLALLVAALVLGGAAFLFLSRTSAQQARVVHLAQGWNLVTWTGASQSTSGALAGVGDAVQAVYGYSNDSQSFTRYIFGMPEISPLTDFETEGAYWVLTLRATDWSVPSAAESTCPAPTPCPNCPTPSLQGELCTSYKMGIELNTIFVEIADEGLYVGQTAAELRAVLQQDQQNFNQYCQGVTLLQPTLATADCAIAAKWVGIEDTTVLYAPSAQVQVWGNQFDSIVHKYCLGQ